MVLISERGRGCAGASGLSYWVQGRPNCRRKLRLLGFYIIALSLFSTVSRSGYQFVRWASAT